MILSGKPFAPAAERNRESIASVIVPLFSDIKTVLEIGSGTGQHAVYFAARMPHLVWQTSDLTHNHDGIRQWIAESALSNVMPPLELDVDEARWPVERVDAVFTANTLHIMDWSSVQKMFFGVSRVLDDDGLFCVYGPFRYGGKHTSESNARFDASLRSQNPLWSVRDMNDVRELAGRNSLEPEQDHDLPANNRLLVFRKKSD